jgi:3'-phosphoadenosine 5'-phosphosulfate sulfotransferase
VVSLHGMFCLQGESMGKERKHAECRRNLVQKERTCPVFPVFLIARRRLARMRFRVMSISFIEAMFWDKTRLSVSNKNPRRSVLQYCTTV